MTQLPRRAAVYVGVVCATALGLLVVSALGGLAHQFQPLPFTILLLLSVLGSLTRVVHGERSVSFSFIVQLAAIPLLGPWWAGLIGVLSWFAHPVKRWTLVVRAFNGAQHGISVGAAGATYLLLGGQVASTSSELSADVRTLVLPLIVAILPQCIVNAGLLAGIINLQRGVSYWSVFLGTLNPGAISYIGYGMFGVLLAVLWGPAGVGPLSAVLVLAPLYVARWAWAQYAEEHEAYERTVRALVGAVEAKDLYTRGHNERVSRASVMIADQLGMGPDRTEMLRFAGILHDVGKIGVPTRVLRKTGRLTDEEFAAIALHPVRGLDMVRGIEFLKEAYSGILHHHERLDGRGYPMGLQGDDIPEFARIIGVADAFDSMTSTRSYRQARSVAEAVEELRRCSGTQFDPRFVDALVTALERQPWEGAPDPVADGPVDGTTAVFDHDDPSAASPVLPPVAAPPERLL